MAIVREAHLTGKVVGHAIRFLPKRVDRKAKGVTVTKDPKVNALVELQVDERRYTLHSRACEMHLDDAEYVPAVVNELCSSVYHTLQENHPLNSELEFRETVFKNENGSLYRKYEVIA
jgi:hypothetical protein